MKRGPATPLFLQTIGLVLATLISVVVTAMVVILNLPPPAPDVYNAAEVIQVLRTGQPLETPEGDTLELHHVAEPPGLVTVGRRHVFFRNAIAAALKRDINDVVVVQNAPRIVAFGRPPRGARRPLPPVDGREPLSVIGSFQAAVKQPGGGWLMVEPRHLFIDPWQQRVLLVLGISALLISPLAWWFSRRLAAPISAFAVGAERLGRDPDAPPLDIRGSSEIGAAVKAFNEMQERLKRFVTYRTTMIGAIAHDLRTPLTRLRFRIEGVPEELHAKLTSDIDEMEAMIASTLAFVGDSTRPHERTKLEMASLVETVMDEAAETGADAAVEQADRVVVDGDPIALKRLVVNLVDNALKFGSVARGRVFSEDGMAIVEVDDNGPGVPEKDIERAFEPFHRLESSRSRETGGIGLGLAVVRAIARGHGGEVTLHNRAGGGLRARVTLPLALRGRRPTPPIPDPVAA